MYTVSQLNWYPFCFANKFVNSENNSIKFYRSLEWYILKFSWKNIWVLSTGSKVMLVQIWTNKFWTFQHVEDTCPYSLKIMTSFPSQNISFSGYSRNWSVGARSVFLTQCFNSINIFRSTRCARHTNNMPIRLSADPVVTSFEINQFNDAINIFLGNSCKNLAP